MTAPHCPVCESGHIYFTKSGIVCRRCGFDERKKKKEDQSPSAKIQGLGNDHGCEQ